MSPHLGKIKRIGSLRKRVKIQAYADTQTGVAQVLNTYTDIAEVWANVKQLTGIAVTKFKNIGSNVTHQITIKHRSDVTSEQWILYDGNRYRIRNIQDAGDEKKRFLSLLTELDTKKDAYANPNTEDANVDDNEFLPT